MAAEPSWTTIRRPVASSSVAGAVTMASIATARSVILRARAIETVAIAPVPGVGEPDQARRWETRPAPATTTTSAGIADPDPVAVERARARGPLAHDPDDPVRRADARSVSIRLETSAITLTDDAAVALEDEA